jgi:hypothetical protein
MENRNIYPKDMFGSTKRRGEEREFNERRGEKIF